MVYCKVGGHFPAVVNHKLLMENIGKSIFKKTFFHTSFEECGLLQDGSSRLISKRVTIIYLSTLSVLSEFLAIIYKYQWMGCECGSLNIIWIIVNKF